MFIIWSICCFIVLILIPTNQCYLRPEETASRQIKSLDGIWKFRLVPEQGLKEVRDEHTVPKDVSLI